LTNWNNREKKLITCVIRSFCIT